MRRPEWLDPTTSSRLAGVSTSTLRAWAKRGKIRAWRTSGGRYLYARSDILAHLPEPVRIDDRGASEGRP